MATLGSTLFSVDKAFQLKTWILVAVSHNELFTDDTYEFSRGMKAVMGAVAELKHLKGKSAGKLAEGEDDTSLLKYLDQSVLDERLLAIVDAMSTMRDKYRAGQPWCKGQIEQAFARSPTTASSSRSRCNHESTSTSRHTSRRSP